MDYMLERLLNFFINFLYDFVSIYEKAFGARGGIQELIDLLSFFVDCRTVEELGEYIPAFVIAIAPLSTAAFLLAALFCGQ